MGDALKTFQVICPHGGCERPFHVRFALAKADAEGSGEVVVECLYCGEPVKIEIPREYVGPDVLIRGIVG